MKVINKTQILAAFDADSITQLLKTGFIAYSARQVQMPPVQHFRFEAAAGDCCIKSAWLEREEYFVVKVSSGFYHNPQQGLPSNQGLMMAFSAQTGKPQVLLLDEGWLTALRTALAGRIAAELCAPQNVQAIGIVGTGMQAWLQLQHLKTVTDCRQVWLWGRSPHHLADYCQRAEAEGFQVNTTQNAAELAAHCNLIVTTTPSREPLLQAEDIRPGTHITAVGSDAEGKQELATALVAKADTILVDALSQCSQYGEIARAYQQNLLASVAVVEFGEILARGERVRKNEQQITLADLTGLAIQDAQIVKGILAKL
ncbi:ornithine cyclodeaminase family protein [Serratia sp. DD3]|uniref:ornithine cyclodeaminase family protein n=1 Tax=Serratia sp. DD3 TaxID=1410619 RepID=UPI0003C4E405|nr:ornithine cyclodeaminase family protein [Serratia sp. DD3]KEY56551.1 ornithine cyclodeaminase [Serratia sp. DD3]KEY56771.1 ornithine cyclodeaminase [Serratia sp. DD3]KEY58296.1 ornithine cyclodeaminase [Serratia sp. DD3]KEY59482.1 ornithine cyclodeaminase [Serratia sp. DD3]